MKHTFSFAALCGLLAFPAFAQIANVPPLMNFQGRLAKLDGTPLPDGAYPVTFSLWNVASGGSVMTNQVWTETDTVTVRNGVFALLLGNTTALSDSLFAGDMWLQIQVKTDAPLSPRQRLVSVGYAFKANSANTVPDNSITAAKLASDPFSLAKVSGNAIVNNNGFIGIGVSNPQERLHLNGEMLFENSNVIRAKNASGVEEGFIWPRWGDNATYFDFGDGGLNIRNNQGALILFMQANGNVGIGTSNPQNTLDVSGGVDARHESHFSNGNYIDPTPGVGYGLKVSQGIAADSITISGADVAEPYLIAAANDVPPAPGLVVRIDPEHPGHLQVAAGEYDGAVAGIISGANGVRPGVVLRQPGTLADGNMPVASVGRVYCWCDADANGPIRSGDLLTTSNTPGHAMRVTDHARAQGAVIGKAMMPLAKGKGMILVLVTLQ